MQQKYLKLVLFHLFVAKLGKAQRLSEEQQVVIEEVVDELQDVEELVEALAASENSVPTNAVKLEQRSSPKRPPTKQRRPAGKQARPVAKYCKPPVKRKAVNKIFNTQNCKDTLNDGINEQTCGLQCYRQVGQYPYVPVAENILDIVFMEMACIGTETDFSWSVDPKNQPIKCMSRKNWAVNFIKAYKDKYEITLAESANEFMGSQDILRYLPLEGMTVEERIAYTDMKSEETQIEATPVKSPDFSAISSAVSGQNSGFFKSSENLGTEGDVVSLDDEPFEPETTEAPVLEPEIPVAAILEEDELLPDMAIVVTEAPVDEVTTASTEAATPATTETTITTTTTETTTTTTTTQKPTTTSTTTTTTTTQAPIIISEAPNYEVNKVREQVVCDMDYMKPFKGSITCSSTVNKMVDGYRKQFANLDANCRMTCDRGFELYIDPSEETDNPDLITRVTCGAELSQADNLYRAKWSRFLPISCMPLQVTTEKPIIRNEDYANYDESDGGSLMLQKDPNEALAFGGEELSATGTLIVSHDLKSQVKKS